MKPLKYKGIRNYSTSTTAYVEGDRVKVNSLNPLLISGRLLKNPQKEELRIVPYVKRDLAIIKYLPKSSPMLSLRASLRACPYNNLDSLSLNKPKVAISEFKLPNESFQPLPQPALLGVRRDVVGLGAYNFKSIFL